MEDTFLLKVRKQLYNNMSGIWGSHQQEIKWLTTHRTVFQEWSFSFKQIQYPWKKESLVCILATLGWCFHHWWYILSRSSCAGSSGHGMKMAVGPVIIVTVHVCIICSVTDLHSRCPRLSISSNPYHSSPQITKVFLSLCYRTITSIHNILPFRWMRL